MHVSKKPKPDDNGLLRWAGADGLENLAKIRVLVVGAGGLGCEILKNLSMSGFRQVDIIDMDTIELTNLNRQFLFDEDNIGQPKAEIAAQRIRACTQCQVTAHVCRIEDKPDSFYENFHIVVCGLDSVQARRWINAKLVQLCLNDPSPSGLRPLIDGGSEGYRGQARVILPTLTPCYECTLSLLLNNQTTAYALCTIASVPRLPEHCIEWVRLIKWPQFHSRIPDFDDESDMQWIYDESLKRALQFQIDGVSMSLVYGVLKRIIPAVASTNAIIAASCCLEALKIATGKHYPIDNYFMYAGDQGTYSTVIKFERKDDCAVCGSLSETIKVDKDQTLLHFLEYTLKYFKLQSARIPSISTANGKALYISEFRETQNNLHKSVSSLLTSGGEEVALTHPELAFALKLFIEII